MQIDDSQKLGVFIRTLRKRMNINQKDLALASGTGLRFIGELEKGKPTCQLGKTLLVLKTLGIKIELTPSIAFSEDKS